MKSDIPRSNGPHTLEAPKDWWEPPAGYKDAPTQINTQSIEEAIGLLAWTCVILDKKKRTQNKTKNYRKQSSRLSSPTPLILSLHQP